jgi:monoamine oxidase
VNTRDGRSFQAEKILITVPVSVLASGALAFSPTLPAYQSAAGQIGVGGVVKFLFEFHDAFWENSIRHPMPTLRFLFSDAVVPTWWSQLPDATPLLTGWLGGPAVSKIPDDQQALFGRALQSLAYAFGCDEAFIRGKLKAWRVDHWLADPFSLGAYSYDKIGSTEARRLLNTVVSDTVYFAGEALYSGPHTGTVEAALTSGRDAAKKMMREE